VVYGFCRGEEMILKKSHPKSVIQVFTVDERYSRYSPGNEYDVLQTMRLSDTRFIAEVISHLDYKEAIEKGEIHGNN
jgi:hypothetical protein